MSLPPDLTVLLACIRFQLGTITASEVTNLLTPVLNWDCLVQTAIAQGVMPLLYESLKAIGTIEGTDNAPPLVQHSVMMQLQHLHRMNGLNNLSQTKELLKILDGLDKANIEAIAFKGSVLAAFAYGNIALRQFNDLDIFVRQRDFWQAKAVLMSHGYLSPYLDSADEMEGFDRYLQISLSNRNAEATMFGRQFQPSLLHSNPERSIDLHWGIPPRILWKSDGFDLLWENLARVDLMGRSIQTFSLEATLVIQCLNVAKEPWKRSFKQVCDAAQIIHRHSTEIDWHSALEIASALRCQRLFLLGLYQTHRLLHIQLPLEIQTQFDCDPHMSEWQFAEDRCFSMFQPMWWWEYNARFHTLDRWWDGLFITLHFLPIGLKWLLSLLKHLIVPNDRDREFYPLPKALFFLYYLIRPIRLLLKFSPVDKSVTIEQQL
ncbi:nucleotidyltransferase domain-containing protein [Chamaesiphon polymorphus]|nr:nucleotidyltransferase family protein [Chamaesiphon polymorphus]